MPLPYVQNKKHIYANRAKNRDKFNEYQRILTRKSIDYKRSNDYEYTAKLFRRILY